MEDDMEERVRHFVAVFHAASIDRVHADTDLLGDLGVDGDDGRDLLLEFSSRFSVDISEFDISRHFGPEGFPIWAPLAPLVWLVSMILPKSCMKSWTLEPLTVNDLIEAASRGKWVYPHTSARTI